MQRANVHPKKVYQIRETLFDKLDSFGLDYTNVQTLFKNLVTFDVDSIFVQEENFEDTDTQKWIANIFPSRSPFHQT